MVLSEVDGVHQSYVNDNNITSSIIYHTQSEQRSCSCTMRSRNQRVMIGCTICYSISPHQIVWRTEWQVKSLWHLWLTTKVCGCFIHYRCLFDMAVDGTRFLIFMISQSAQRKNLRPKWWNCWMFQVLSSCFVSFVMVIFSWVGIVCFQVSARGMMAWREGVWYAFNVVVETTRTRTRLNSRFSQPTDKSQRSTTLCIPHKRRNWYVSSYHWMMVIQIMGFSRWICIIPVASTGE